MIIADKEVTKIAGMNYIVIYEFNNIINALQQDNPEILLGVLTAWSDVIMNLDNVDKTELAIVTHASEEFIRLHNESEDDND